jgi:predicted DNA-binding transcriptional regulator AlpA
MPVQLLGTHEIRIRLGGISRQRAHQITTTETFPKPVATLMLGKVWRADDVEAWIRRYRPARHPTDV